MTKLIILVFLLMAVALAATLLVAFGPKDKPYGVLARQHWKKLGVFYGICALLLLGIFLYVFS
ncbi:hypothetical protein [Brevibacillus borstelensis]|uniref:hypothetical protein n=1 Tax=Brevibacillus borstelensis TaxID=45462 RepID=UPI0030C37FD4